MRDERFGQLKASVLEAGKIARGEMSPSRRFAVTLDRLPQERESVWAICLESDDQHLLIPRKLYAVKYGESGVLLTDESGEPVICDKEDFLPLAFDPEVEHLLDRAA